MLTFLTLCTYFGSRWAVRSTHDLAPALQAIREDRLRAYLKDQYVLPEGPEPKNSARQMAYAADIFGRMVEEDVGAKNRMTAFLRSVGGIAAGVVGLLTPGSLGRVFWNYWLALFGLTAALLFALASITGESRAKALGAYGIAAAVLMWFLSWITGDLLARFKISPYVIRALKWLLAIVLMVLVLIGLLHLPQEAQGFWQRIRHTGGSP